jgi:hypothetical protein
MRLVSIRETWVKTGAGGSDTDPEADAGAKSPESEPSGVTIVTAPGRRRSGRA